VPEDHPEESSVPKYNLMIGRFPYGDSEDSRCVDWLLKTVYKLSTDRRFNLQFGKLADTPIDMTRNAMVQTAMEQETDILLIIDNDLDPDCELGEDPDAKPFLETTLDFMLNHAGPCIVAAPYCGPPPIENVYVFQWGDHMSDDHDGHGSLNQYTREQAAVMAGIREVAALPTGLMAIDMRAFKGIKPPYFYYEWKGDGPPCPQCGVCKPGPRTEKGSTEDVTITRDLSLAGVKQYCNWDAWAAHIKKKRVRKPRPWTTDMVSSRMQEAILRGVHSRDRLMDIKPTSRFAADIAAAMAGGPVNVGDGVYHAEPPLPPAAEPPRKKTYQEIVLESEESRRLLEESAARFAGDPRFQYRPPVQVMEAQRTSPVDDLMRQVAARMEDPGEDFTPAVPELVREQAAKAASNGVPQPPEPAAPPVVEPLGQLSFPDLLGVV
jgi:hypothetical protein